MYLLAGIIILLLILQNNINILSTKEAEKLIKNNYFKTILDVRSLKEWNQGHYNGAIHIPHDKITSSKVSILEEPILIYCRSGRRAKIAAEKIKKLGKNKISIIEGSYKLLD